MTKTNFITHILYLKISNYGIYKTVDMNDKKENKTVSWDVMTSSMF